jgi:hypothetical protein
MNIKNMPGFTGEHSIYKTISHFQTKGDRSLSSGKNDNRVYLQKPNNENTGGGKCHATSFSGTATVSVGTYDSSGWCCGPTVCINCDNGSCFDGDASKGGRFKLSYLPWSALIRA